MSIDETVRSARQRRLEKATPLALDTVRSESFTIERLAFHDESPLHRLDNRKRKSRNMQSMTRATTRSDADLLATKERLSIPTFVGDIDEYPPFGTT
ncbi:hypothetical protein [Sphingomonas panacisoli]|nr:hypothetical protein [Sphingomonas panacisoli]